jgi:hypothetical protein
LPFREHALRLLKQTQAVVSTGGMPLTTKNHGRTIAMMTSRAIPLLALCSNLVLALPSGWCCYVAPAGRVETPCEVAAPRCPHCCDAAPAQPTPLQREPAKPEACPVCGDRDLVKPSQPETLANDLLALPALPLPVAIPVPATGTHDVIGSGGDLTRPLHLLHCVWTC